MKHIQFADLLIEDLMPYRETPSVVRLYIPEDSLFFFGRLDRTAWEDASKALRIHDGYCEVLINPLIRIGRKLLVPVDPQNPGDVFIRKEWLPVTCSLTREQRPFRLQEPRRILWPLTPLNVLGIQGGERVALISFRPADIARGDELIQQITNIHARV